MFDIYFYKTINSTITESIRLINENVIINNSIIFALEQSNGITTKKDVQWASPNGNLYVTYVFKIDNINKNTIFTQIPFCVSLSVKNFIIDINERFQDIIQIKWPNDILINQNKVGGVLCNKYKEYFMLSIGLNLISHPIKTLNFTATNLKDELLKIDSNNNFFNIFEENTIKNVNDNDIKDFLQHIVIDIGEKINQYLINLKTFGFHTIKKEWLNFAFLLNEKIILTNFKDKNLKFINISDIGEIICINLDNNKIYNISSDEIILI